MPAPRGREILEVFEVNGAPAQRESTPPLEPRAPERRRWIGLGAAGAVMASVVGFLSISDDAPKRAAPTTVATTSTVLSSRAADAPVLPVLSEAPPGYQLADIDQPKSSDQAVGVTELWATAGATADNGGTWFMVTSVKLTNGSRWVNGDRRVRLSDGTVAMFSAGSRARHVAPKWTTSDGETLTTVSGNADPYLMAEVIAGSGVVDSDGDGTPDEITYENEGFASAMHLVAHIGADDHGASPLDNIVGSRVTFTLADTWAGFIDLDAGPQRSTDRQAVSDFFLDQHIDLGHGGTDGSFGTLPDGGTRLSFDLAGISVTVASSVADRAAMVAIAEHVNVATDEAWSIAETQIAPPPPLNIGSRASVQVAGGSLDGTDWAATVDGPMWDGTLVFAATVGGIGTANAVVGPADQPWIEVGAWADETVLLAHAPRIDAGARLRLTIGLDAPIEVPLIDADPSLPWLVTALPFSQLDRWTAEIVDADGNVLAQTSSDIESVMVAP